MDSKYLKNLAEALCRDAIDDAIELIEKRDFGVDHRKINNLEVDEFNLLKSYLHNFDQNLSLYCTLLKALR